MQRSPVLLLALAVGAWSLVRIWALRHLGRTRDWQMLEAHKGNLRLGTHNESLLLRHLECNLCKLKDQTRPSKSLKEFRPTRQARWVKQKTRDTTQYKIVIVYIFKKKKKINIWKFSPAGRGVNWKEQDWLLCRRQVRYKQVSNLGLGGFSTQH